MYATSNQKGLKIGQIGTWCEKTNGSGHSCEGGIDLNGKTDDRGNIKTSQGFQHLKG